jgi:hypothetical protein
MWKGKHKLIQKTRVKADLVCDFGVGMNARPSFYMAPTHENTEQTVNVQKAVPQHIYGGGEGRGGIAPTHLRRRH